MAKTSTLSISASVVGDGVNESWNTVNPITSWSNAAAPGGIPQSLVLASGDNTVAIPTGSQNGTGSMILIGPTGSVVTKKIKGIGGDTGVVFDPARPLVWPIPTSTTTILINASAGETVQVFWL